MTTLTLKMLSPYYLTTMNNDFELHYRLAELVTLTQGLRSEWRFVPLAWGQ